MQTWRLFRGLTTLWYASGNPVFSRQIARHPAWTDMVGRVLRRPSGLIQVLGGMLCGAIWAFTATASNPLMLAVPLLGVWLLLVGLSVGPSLVEERQRRTWETLRVTPLGVDAIVLGKAGGALWWLRRSVYILGGLILLSAALIGTVGVVTMAQPYARYSDHAPLLAVCSATILVPLAIALLFVFDRLQQFMLLVTSALAVSASTRSVRVSVSGGVALMLVLWALDAGIAVVVVAFSGEQTLGQMGSFGASMATLGPSVGYLARLPLDVALPVIGITLTIREVLVWGVWRWR